MAKLSKYKKDGIVIIDKGNKTLDTPIFQIVTVFLDNVTETVDVEILHTVLQGTVEQEHSSNESISSVNVYNGKKLDLSLVMDEVLLLPQYAGAVEQ